MIFMAKKHFLAVSGTSLDSSTSATENENLQLVLSSSSGAGLVTRCSLMTLFFVHQPN